MTKILTTVSVDQKAALLAGRVLDSSGQVDLAPEDLGGFWPSFVSRVTFDGPKASARFITVDDLTPQAVLVWFEKEAAALQEARATLGSQIETMRVNLELVRVAAKAPPVSVERYAPDTKYAGLTYPKLERDLPYWAPQPAYGWETQATPDQKALVALLKSQYDTIVSTHTEELRELNERAYQEALPDLEKRLQEKIAAEQAAENVKKEAQALKFAERLETGYWEKETSSYNDRRYSAPWCAKITFPEGAKPSYAFGESTASRGSSGLLRIACKPGEIIAWGQKDLRRPDKSDHYLLLMRPNGSMQDIDKTEAYRVYKQL